MHEKRFDAAPVVLVRTKNRVGCVIPDTAGSVARVTSRLLVAFAVLMATTCLSAPPGQSKDSTEYEIKAEFLYSFAKFVEWPPSAFADPKQQLGICVFGRDPFGHVLEDVLLGKSIGNHPVLLGYAKRVPDLAGCQVIFLTADEAPHLLEIIGFVRGHNVLIVGESEGFAAAGGTIQFVLDQNRVRFAINPGAAKRAGLKISSKLLALALIVHDDARSTQAKN
ncbi:MAG: YfiR family protein [Candidatus Acidiferrales bacterium]